VVDDELMQVVELISIPLIRNGVTGLVDDESITAGVVEPRETGPPAWSLPRTPTKP
jgi:hypothetical protein